LLVFSHVEIKRLITLSAVNYYYCLWIDEGTWRGKYDLKGAFHLRHIGVIQTLELAPLAEQTPLAMEGV